MTFDLTVRIPMERVGVLIGPEGSTKSLIEGLCKVELLIDSSVGDVKISPKKDVDDPTLCLKAQSIVQAVGRGFSPERALKLTDDNYSLSVLDLEGYMGGSRQNLQRIKGRLIGSGGKTRRIIEEMTNVSVSIYGDTVSLIGRPEELEVSREAIFKLIEGSEHRTVYRYLSDRRQEMKKEKIKLWESKDNGHLA